MSAPETNLERQKRRHRGPLVGITAAVLTALILFGIYLGVLAERGVEDGDQPVPEQIEAPTD